MSLTITEPSGAMSDWKTRLDARISRCEGCDEWCWDRHCNACENEPELRGAA